MRWLIRGIVLIFILLAVFWLLALLVGWLRLIVIGAVVVSTLGFLIWLFASREPKNKVPKVGKRSTRRASKELSKLERRLKNPPQG